MKEILKFTIPFPKIGVGKKKNQLATVNNIPYFYRFHKTRIKNGVKTRLKDWLLPKNEGKVYREGLVEFRLYRPSKKRLDADAGSGTVYKWIVDTLVEQGYFEDDDQITFVLKPVIVETHRVETDIEVKVFIDES
jgi:hypothetical protein